MASDSRLPLLIFAALVALIAIPFLVDHFRGLRRPVLLEARVVTASETDPVFRTGQRQADVGEAVEIALALRIGRRGTEGRWFAPFDRLAIDGSEIEHDESTSWPEKNESVRVFWFSVESANLGGSLNAINAGQRLQYRTFLAPEMGRGLRALQLPEFHNDDHIGERSTTAPEGAGTFRIYARVEIVESDPREPPLPVRWREIAAVLLLVVLADVAIYRSSGFAGYSLFFLGAPLLLLLGAPRPRLGVGF